MFGAKINIPMGAVATPCRPNARTMRFRNRAVATSELTAQPMPKETKTEVVPQGKAKIYVGKGRFIVDDPAKYPDRTTLTGGFAGGEVRTVSAIRLMAPSCQKWCFLNSMTYQPHLSAFAFPRSPLTYLFLYFQLPIGWLETIRLRA
jgi:hypothetical protein